SSANACVGPAPAEVSGNTVLNLLQCGIGVMVKKRLTSHHKSRSAKAALLRIVVNKSLLDGMKLAILRQAFNRGDRMGLCVNGQHRAGINSFAIQVYGTCAAGAA